MLPPILCIRPFDMGGFWRWLMGSVLMAGVLYAMLIALSGIFLSWRADPFDAALATTTQPGWVNEARYFIQNKAAFAVPENRFIILGASTARDPFRPPLMEPKLPGWRVANASLSGASIREIGDEIDLYYREKKPGSAGRTVFVFCLTYLQLRPSPTVAGLDNPLATEAMRGGLYERYDGKLRPRYPKSVELMMTTALRPQAIAASLPRRIFRAIFVNPDLPLIKNFVDRFRGSDPLARWTERIGEEPNLNSMTVPPAIQGALLAQRLKDAGGDVPLPTSEFAHLAGMIEMIKARGDRVVIVDLPLPTWHRIGVTKAEASYDTQMNALINRYSTTNMVSHMSLRNFGDNDNFYDSGHTKPKLWPVMSVALANKLAVQSGRQ
jgi:hypothetical protein